MDNFEEARKLYLRGFNGEYIKSQTGISVQKLLKNLLSNGIRYTDDDIVNYQVDYISARYTIDEIKSAYENDIIMRYDNPDSLRRGKHILALDCGFGNYPSVFSKLLGEDVYKTMKNQCWKKKQNLTVYQRYGVNNVFEKSTFDKFVSADAIEKGREKRTQTLLRVYGVEHPNQNKDIADRMVESSRKTFKRNYGTDNPMKVSEIAKQSAIKRQNTMYERYGFKNSVEITEIRNKIFDKRAQNHTLNSSLSEDYMYDLLLQHFGKDDVRRNVIVDGRYPYHVDFYIVSRDLFIELNGDKCHGFHWYDKNNDADRLVVADWKIRSLDAKQKGIKHSRYDKFIETWTVRDVEKRLIAKQNKLNYLVFWDSKVRKVNGERVPLLSDFRDWLDADCPDSIYWNSVNTY